MFPLYINIYIYMCVCTLYLYIYCYYTLHTACISILYYTFLSIKWYNERMKSHARHALSLATPYTIAVITYITIVITIVISIVIIVISIVISIVIARSYHLRVYAARIYIFITKLENVEEKAK